MRFFRNLLTLLLAGLLFLAPVALLIGPHLMSDPRRSYFGYRFYNVLTQSMRPAFNAGDAIIVRLCMPEAVEAGDIITYSQGAGSTSTHRVVEVVTELYGEPGLWFLTKGDNNQAPDPLVPAERLIGKVTGRLPGVGRLASFARDHKGAALLAALCAILLCWGLAALLLVLLALRGRRRCAPPPRAVLLTKTHLFPPH